MSPKPMKNLSPSEICIFCQVEGLLLRNLTLEEEAKAGHIYLVDYKILEGKQLTKMQIAKFCISFKNAEKYKIQLLWIWFKNTLFSKGISTGWEGGAKDAGGHFVKKIASE